MPKQAETLKELAQVRADNRRLLNMIVGSQGTALGRRNFTPDGEPDGEPCIIAYVPQKLPKVFLDQDIQIPSKLFTRDRSLVAPTDVVVSTLPSYSSSRPVLSPENWNLVLHLRWLDGKLNRLVPGA